MVHEASLAVFTPSCTRTGLLCCHGAADALEDPPLWRHTIHQTHAGCRCLACGKRLSLRSLLLRNTRDQPGGLPFIVIVCWWRWWMMRCVSHVESVLKSWG